MKTIERTEAETQARIAFQPKDVLSQVIIAALAVAPDASSIVYVRRTVEDGKYARRLWRTTFGGAKPEQLTSAKASDNRPRFSPDGRSLVFISDRAGKPQAWVISLSGGEPRQVTDIPGGVTAAEWSPDGKKLLLLAASGELSHAWTPGDQIAFGGVDRPGFPGWADMELHVSDGKSTQRLAADLHLNIQSTSYGDYQDGEQFGPPPLLWQDEQSLVALVSHHGYSHPYRFGVDGSVQALAGQAPGRCRRLRTG